MEVEYKLEIDDAMAFYRYHWEHGPEEHRPKYAGCGNVVVLGLIVLVLVVIEMALFDELSIPAIFLLSVLVWLVYCTTVQQIFGPELVDYNVRKFLESCETKGDFQHSRLTLSAQGLHSVSEHTNSDTKWSGIEQLAVTDKHLFLYTNSCQAIIVPKWAFDNEQRFAEFVDQARQYHAAHHGDRD